MKKPNKEKIFREVAELITPEQEKDFFVLCETDRSKPAFHTGGLKRNNNGYGDCVIFMKFSDEPISRFDIPKEKSNVAHKNFESAKDYYENTLCTYRVFPLKDGIKVLLENNLWNPNASYENEGFIKRLDDWYWNEWCPHVENYLSKNDDTERSENLRFLSDVMEIALC